MEGAFKLPIHIHYHPPGWLFIVLTICHTGAIICVFTIPVLIWVKLMFFITIISSYLCYGKRYIKSRNLDIPVQLILTIDDEWKLIDEKGDRYVELLPGAYVHPGLVVLRFKDDNNKVYPFILTPVSVNRDILRRLRVRLRFNKF